MIVPAVSQLRDWIGREWTHLLGDLLTLLRAGLEAASAVGSLLQFCECTLSLLFCAGASADSKAVHVLSSFGPLRLR